MADAIKVNVMIRNGSGAWSNSDAGEIKNDPAFTLATNVLASGNYAPVAAKIFTWPLKVTAAIQDTNTLSIGDSTSLDGSATISLVYL